MGVLDSFNGRWDRGTMRLASVATEPDWGYAEGDDEPEFYYLLASYSTAK